MPVASFDKRNIAIRNKKAKKIQQISVDIDKEILTVFRETIYYRMGLKRGDFKTAIEVAMLDYIQKYSKSKNSMDFVKRIKEEWDYEHKLQSEL